MDHNLKRLLFMVAVLGIVLSDLRGASANDDSVRWIELNLALEDIAFAKDEDLAIAISKGGRQVVYIDLASGAVSRLLPEEESSFGTIYTDFALSDDGRHLYVVGVRKDNDVGASLIRINLATKAVSEFVYPEYFESPSVAVSDNGNVYVGDKSSSVISVLSAKLFADGRRSVARRDNSSSNLFLKGGTTANLTVEPGGQVLWIENSQSPILSAIDANTGELLMRIFEREDDEGNPIVVSRYVFQRDINRKVIAVVSRIEAGLFSYTSEERFITDEQVQKARHSLQALSYTEREHQISPMMTAMDPEMRTIIVANKNSARVNIYKGTPSRRGLMELVGFAIADFAPQSLDVSSSGERLLLVPKSPHGVALITNVRSWVAEKRLRKPDTLVLRAQKALAELNYPVKVADGLLGDKSRAAVQEFQKELGWKVTGKVDATLVEKIEEVSKERQIIKKLEAVMTSTAEGSSGKTNQSVTSLRTSLKDICQVKKSNDHCFAAGFWAPDRLNNESAEQQYCGLKPVDARKVQADLYYFFGNIADYICSYSHSCAFLKHTDIEIYAATCRARR